MISSAAYRLIGDLKKKYGNERVVVADTSDIAQRAATADAVVLPMDCGDLTQAKGAAIAANVAVAMNPKIKLMYCVSGCDDDPRELDQIPNARIGLTEFRRWLELPTFMRFDQQQRALLLVATGTGVRRGTDLLVPMTILGEAHDDSTGTID